MNRSRDLSGLRCPRFFFWGLYRYVYSSKRLTPHKYNGFPPVERRRAAIVVKAMAVDVLTGRCSGERCCGEAHSARSNPHEFHCLPDSDA